MINFAPMYLFSIGGGFLIGWELGTAPGGGKAQWWLQKIMAIGLSQQGIGVEIKF